MRWAHSSLCLSVCLCGWLSVCVWLSGFLSVSVCVAVCLAGCVWLSVSGCLCLAACVWLSGCLCLAVCVWLAVSGCLSGYLSPSLFLLFFLSICLLSGYLHLSVCLSANKGNSNKSLQNHAQWLKISFIFLYNDWPGRTTNVCTVWFSYSNNCTMVEGIIFHSV